MGGRGEDTPKWKVEFVDFSRIKIFFANRRTSGLDR